MSSFVRYTKYPHPLFYIRNANQIQFSFVPVSVLPIGSMPSRTAEAGIVKDERTDRESHFPLDPSTFVPNPEFERFLHDFIRQEVHKDESLKALAAHQKTGFLNLNDMRVSTPFGRVADPEDILGVVRLKEGEMVPGSYERVPTHRLVSLNGLTVLSDQLHKKLVDKLAKLNSKNKF